MIESPGLRKFGKSARRLANRQSLFDGQRCFQRFLPGICPDNHLKHTGRYPEFPTRHIIMAEGILSQMDRHASFFVCRQRNLRKPFQEFGRSRFSGITLRYIDLRHIRSPTLADIPDPKRDIVTISCRLYREIGVGKLRSDRIQTETAEQIRPTRPPGIPKKDLRNRPYGKTDPVSAERFRFSASRNRLLRDSLPKYPRT